LFDRLAVNFKQYEPAKWSQLCQKWQHRREGRIAVDCKKVEPEMRKTIVVTIAVVLALASNSMNSDISALNWDQSNIHTLRSFDKGTVVALVNEHQPGVLTATEVSGFGWADPGGNGQYQLVLILSGPCADFVATYYRDTSGKVTLDQRIEGFGNLKTGLRDLNCDGKDELIIGQSIVEHSCVDVVAWPAAYRFEKGKYVEASRDFPSYYDNEVLPQLAARIAKYQGRATDLSGDLGAGPTMERDKILRVLGRDPTAAWRRRANGLTAAIQT
jgi:hypothetical protein